jgi:acetylornithine/succinyldiaminopimelate/putrescine aminotransferase
MLETPAPPTIGAGTAVDPLLGIYRRPEVEFVRGGGIELFDAAGRGYLDFTSGIGVNALGYGDPGIAAAARDALASGIVHASNLFHTGPGRALAGSLTAKSFAASVFFCNSGAEANEGAFKFARRWARENGGEAKHTIIALRGGFHGRLFASLAATDRPEYRAPFTPLAGGVRIIERDLGELERALGAGDVAAVIAEPVQGEGGVRVLEPEFLRALRTLTAAHGTALILDEVQCGLGRTGRLFAHQRAGIEPDLMTLAKPLAGGFPMGAVLMTSEIAATLKPGDHGTTFGGGPVVAAVANYVLGRLSDEALLAHVRDDGDWLGDALRAVAARTGRIRALRGIGFMWGVDVMEPASAIIGRAREQGLLLCSAGEYTIRLLPPLVAERAELARGIALLEGAL